MKNIFIKIRKKSIKKFVYTKKVLTFASLTETVPNGVVVQLVRMPACHAGGRGFESRPFRKNPLITLIKGFFCCTQQKPHSGTRMWLYFYKIFFYLRRIFILLGTSKYNKKKRKNVITQIIITLKYKVSILIPKIDLFGAKK